MHTCTGWSKSLPSAQIIRYLFSWQSSYSYSDTTHLEIILLTNTCILNIYHKSTIEHVTWSFENTQLLQSLPRHWLKISSNSSNSNSHFWLAKNKFNQRFYGIQNEHVQMNVKVFLMSIYLWNSYQTLNSWILY